jgi:hypothetical protein
VLRISILALVDLSKYLSVWSVVSPIGMLFWPSDDNINFMRYTSLSANGAKKDVRPTP